MKTVYQVKEFIKLNAGKNVAVKVLGIRNKIDLVEGIISECHNRVFIVKTKFCNKSFNYVDILIGNIKITVK